MVVHDVRFAPGIMNRFAAHRVLSGRPPELIVVRQRARVWVQKIIHRHSALHVAIRLATTVSGPSPEGGRSDGLALTEPKTRIAPPVGARAASPGARTIAPAAAPLAMLLAGASRGHDADDRQRQSQQRVAGSATQQPTEPRPSLLVGVPAVRRVLRGARSDERERRIPPAPVTESRSSTRIEVKAHGRGPRPAETAVDVNALTERVIHAIDRRIVAQRERMGRP